MSVRFRKVEQLYHQALEKPEADRTSFLDEACAGDESLRLEVEELLACNERAGRFMEVPAMDVAARMMARARTALEPGSQIGQYEILSLLGSGGMGEVYLVRDTRLDRKAAMKILPPELAADQDRMRRFMSEAKAASALSHPNVATIYEIGEADGIHFITMEYVEGETLDSTIHGQPLEKGALLNLATQIVSAVEEAHRKGVIHRDIKPANIMITSSRQVKILDFGLAKITGQEKPTDPGGREEPGTSSGIVMGTAQYMSPEQVVGRRVDCRTDIFSLGVVLYDMATGRLPFNATATTGVVDRILHSQPEAMARFNYDLPVELERIVRKCLEKDPALRYQSAGELLIDLKRLSTSASASESPRGRHSAKWLRVTAAAMLISVAGGTGGYVAWRHFGFQARPPAGRIMLAVLPAENLSGDPAQEYFSDGLTEELIAKLGNMQPERLGVIARTSVMPYKHGRAGIDEIGGRLGVDYVLETSVRRDSNRLRITAQLIQVRDQTHLWAETYQRNLPDIFAIQSDVAGRVARSLAVELLPAAKAGMERMPTRNPEAYDAYLKGLYWWNRRTEAALRKSIDFFQQAIEKDPTYAAAYSGLANSYSVLGNNQFLPGDETYPKARASAQMALRLDERLAEAHASLAKVMEDYDWNWTGSEAEYRRAIELNPGYATAHQWYAVLLMLLGRQDESLAQIRLARQLDPLSTRIDANVGLLLYYAHRYDEAIREIRKVLDLDPNTPFARAYLGISCLQKGMVDSAIAELSAARASESDNPLLLAYLGCAYAEGGRKSEASKSLHELMRQSVHQHVPPGAIAWLYTALGDRDTAFRWLNEAYDTRDPLLRFLKVEPLLNPLHSDPRFDSLLHRMNFAP
jgi:TolB-like protein/Flp pilus assembly protein TadD/predicted Ser/Thr protein kinase